MSSVPGQPRVLWQGRGAILSITIEKTEVVKSVVNHFKAEKLHSVAINCMRHFYSLLANQNQEKMSLSDFIYPSLIKNIFAINQSIPAGYFLAGLTLSPKLIKTQTMEQNVP